MSAQPQLDRCPGLLHPHVAEDGALVRLRVPGGTIAVSVLREVFATAQAHGAAALQLTSRGNLQLRALPDPLPTRFIERIEATGLLPSATHERVRNILASPLAPDLAPLVAELDAGLLADPSLAELSGRFLFGLADPSGSVLSEPYDLAWQSTGGEDGVLLAAGRGLAVAREHAVPELLARARAFLLCRASASVWNVTDLPGDAPVFAGMTAYQPVVAPPLNPGVVGDDLVAGVPLGFLTSTHVEALAAATDTATDTATDIAAGSAAGSAAGTVVVTPWRSIVVPGGASVSAELAAAGLVTQRDSPWSGLSACIGAPACAKGRCSTLAIAAEVAEASRADPGSGAGSRAEGRRVHIVGCERQCGARAADLVAVAPADAKEVLTMVQARSTEGSR